MGDSLDVLCVDDTDGGTRTATALERRGNFSVETVTTPTTAVDRLAGADFDAVVSGYDFPDQDGLALLRQVRERHGDLPFVLFTGTGSEGVVNDAISAGVSGYLRDDGSDQQYDQLVARLEQLVDQYRDSKRATTDQQHDQIARDELLEITADPALGPEEKIKELLRLGCDRFGLDNGHLVRIDTTRHLHEVISVHGTEVVRTGVSDLLETYCRKTIEEGDVHAIHDARELGWEDDPAFEKFGIECYLGGTISFERDLYGTVCFVGEQPRNAPFSEADHQFFELIRRWCSQLLAQERHRRQAQTVFEYTQDGVFVIEVAADEFQVTRVNQAYEALTGFASEEIRGKTPTEILGPEEGQRVRDRYQECLDSREPVSYEETLTIDGERRHWETKLAPVVENDKVVRLVGATRDVTTQRQQERELREERAFIEQSLDALEDVFYVFDSDGTIRRWNDSLRRVTGYTDEELERMLATDFFPEEQTQQIAAAISEVFETGGARVRADFLTSDGTQIPYEFTGVRLTDPGNGDATGFVGIGRDITDQLTYERELERQNERLEQFASVVSHDLRNPLNVATSHLELAADECNSDHLSDIENALGRMEALIDDILTLAREGKSVSETEPITLETLVNACWRTVDTDDATLVLESRQTIQADRSRFKQLLENLVRNAVEHGGESVTVTVGDLDDGFYVEDDGPGIDPEKREAVFESGYSLSERGSGLGLAIVEQIVAAHGWEICATKSETGGARFEITGVSGSDDDE